VGDEKSYVPESVKLQVLEHAGCILAISVWNDCETKALAEQFGAKALMDKARLFSDLIAHYSSPMGRSCFKRVWKRIFSRLGSPRKLPSSRMLTGCQRPVIFVLARFLDFPR